jgi:hypothetical protein
VTKSWITLVIGVWILVSPWVLGFSDASLAVWSSVICGIILILIAAHSIFISGEGDAGTTGKVAEIKQK